MVSLVTKNEAFQKRCPELIFLKTSFHLVLWSKDRWKRSSPKLWRHNIDLLHIRAWAQVFGDHERAFCLSVFFIDVWMSMLLSSIEFHYRKSYFESLNALIWTGTFSKLLLLWTRVLSYRDKTDMFSEIFWYMWTCGCGLSLYVCFTDIFRQ